ncbi:Peptidoglycan/LPS O-acetylase OafA/YrhL, contains acyltransferase and SGNH-hydrolase domains [Rhizobium tibeticum]|uniref:O-acetyltransferase OatA n=1 Tax=Rhizobium tibeticum TaxID=501024 RepID=A0A1H8IZJ0_9HYPH|nr:acyltransferase [Rhizobium tibeticum]SEH73405.1 O-acetyltransferase OatA [Rhizobium tibeticum]SEN73555.1 Peptidoglycan/LPS O-acetylase OafA/YrhL, contains acyltransferase and SGNH-hydrolase domains [Rhizobium tibeticum]
MLHARERQLDGLRTLAVAMVLYHHFFAVDGSVLGHLGVRLFFVLSGFLITRLLLDARSAIDYEPGTALKSFYIRRALRIFPPYFAMLGFVWFVNLEGARGSLKWHALYLSNFWYALHNEWTPWVLCHTWSLSIEEQFYIAWPLVILLAPRRFVGPICVAVIAFSLAYRFYWPFTGTPALARDLLPPASLDALVAGSLLAVHRSRTEVWPRWMRVGVAPLTAGTVIFLWLKAVPMTPALEWLTWIGAEIFPIVPLVMLVGACSLGLQGGFGRFLELPPITAIGRVSYGVYLFHPIVLSLIVKAQAWIPVNVSEQGPGRFVIATATTLILASISWTIFEKPLNQLKRYFPYVRSKSRAHVPSSIKASEADGRPYDVSAYRPSYANRDEHGI